MRKTTSGFTLVELLIVIVVIAILAAISIVAYNGIQERAQAAALLSESSNSVKKIELYKVSAGAYPTTVSACPTPGEGELCLNHSDDVSIDYTTVSAGVSGYINQLDDSYELSLQTDSSFLYTGKVERTGNNEFMQYVDLAPYIDQYGLREYELSFDIKSANTSNQSSVNVYFQNGSTTRYGGLSRNIPVSTSYQRHTVKFTPTNGNMSVAPAMLAFYGSYGTGNRPIVKNVEFKPAL